MGFFIAIVNFFSGLWTFLRGRQQAAHDAEERKMGEGLQSLGDLQGALNSRTKMAEAQAEAPQSKADLDAKLNAGKF